MRLLQHNITKNVFRYTEILAKRIGVDMIEITPAKAVEVVKEEAKVADAKTPNVDDAKTPEKVVKAEAKAKKTSKKK